MGPFHGLWVLLALPLPSLPTLRAEHVARECRHVRQSTHGGVEMTSSCPFSHMRSHHVEVIEMLGITFLISQLGFSWLTPLLLEQQLGI